VNVGGRLEELPGARVDGGAVRSLVAVAVALDGAQPLDEAQLLALNADASRHLLLFDLDHRLTGYLQMSAPDPRTGDVSAGAVIGTAAGFSRAGAADMLLAAAEYRTEPGHLVIWSRTAAAPIGSAALQRGYAEDRVLLTMSMPTTSEPLAGVDPTTNVPTPGISIRSFVPGQDDAAWLALNAAAFAHHPEQGAWTAADLHERMQQRWFDPAGFLLAVEPGHTPPEGDTAAPEGDAAAPLLGFHWTKIHPGPAPVGEVYVLGTAPAAQGRGVARALLAAGLEYLRRHHVREVILYVDEDNTAAVRLYERSGFTIVGRQAQYRRP
jgi:mycothiol synthase